MKQRSFFKNQTSAFGGELYRKRKGRGPRPLATNQSMHLVFRSSQARGDLSFLRPENKTMINFYVEKFANRFGIQIFGLANVGNHIHLHLKLSNRLLYRSFIRALTSAIVTGIKKLNSAIKLKGKFFDQRPFTRITHGRSDFSNLSRYIQLNALEALGLARKVGRDLVKVTEDFDWSRAKSAQFSITSNLVDKS